jgi:hypothetical protein
LIKDCKHDSSQTSKIVFKRRGFFTARPVKLAGFDEKREEMRESENKGGKEGWKEI